MTKHIDLVWNVDFDKQTISGEAVLHFEIVAKEIERIVSIEFLWLQAKNDIVDMWRMPLAFFVIDSFLL